MRIDALTLASHILSDGLGLFRLLSEQKAPRKAEQDNDRGAKERGEWLWVRATGINGASMLISPLFYVLSLSKYLLLLYILYVNSLEEMGGDRSFRSVLSRADATTRP